MAQHAQVATFQHAKIFDYLIRMRQWHEYKTGYSFIVDPFSDKSKSDKNLRLCDVLPSEEFDPMLGDLAKGILNSVAKLREGVDVVVDKTPENGHFADFILNVLPDAYFLHIVRDPRSVFCSHRSAAKSWAKWDFPSISTDGARVWKKDVEVALTIKDKTERYLEVRYEDLKAEGPSELKRILSWLDLDTDDAFLEQAVAASSKDKVRDTKELPKDFVRKVPKGGWRDELSKGDLSVIEYIGGDLMEQLGYERGLPKSGSKPLRMFLRDLPEPMLALLAKKSARVTNLMHWAWVGRKLHWPNP
ncbi:MAG: hypothetical protein ACI8TQ_003097 [Planctomycetota bacterium]|jgi:hypothetical protein